MLRFALPSIRQGVAMTLAAVLIGTLVAGRADAGFVARISPASTTLAAGESQQFTVYLDSDAGTPDTDVSGFTVRLELTGAVGGVQFTGGVMPASGYIFQDNSFDFGSNLGTQNPDGTGGAGLSITLLDSPNDLPYTVTLPGGQSWVLGLVTVSADASPEGGAVQVRFNSTYSSVDDANVAPLDLSFQGGEFQVQGSGEVSAVPAPGGLILALCGIPLLALWLRVRTESAGVES